MVKKRMRQIMMMIDIIFIMCIRIFKKMNTLFRFYSNTLYYYFV